jgi:hypothetical protein
MFKGKSGVRYWQNGFLVIILLLGFLILPCLLVGSARAADEENCLMCHKHRGMGRIDLKGNKRIFFVSEELFSKSVHGRVPCRGCHINISEIPHKVQVIKVDCGTQCHKKEPSTGIDFSHRPIYTNYQRSVHGTDLKNPEPGKPVCKYCHQNPLYTRTYGKEARIAREKPIERILARCNACHTNKEWATTFYMHVEHRLMKRTFRSRRKVVKLCSSCHDNSVLMKKLGLSEKSVNAVRTYKMTYHYKALMLGRTDTADCIDCHTYYEPYSPHNVHLVLRASDPESAIHPDNKGKICGQDGCHDGHNAAGPRAGPELAELNLHADFSNPSNFWEFIVFEVYLWLIGGTILFLTIVIFLELLRRLI